jgi:predicted ATP-grasp superfamily ATP-dependent carboligase
VSNVAKVQLPGAIVFDATSPAALGVIRALGEQGIAVLAIDRNRWAPGLHSKYGSARVLPSAWLEQNFLEYLLRDPRLNGWLLLPTSDQWIAFVAQNHLPLSQKFVLVTPPWDITVKCLDKAVTHEVARHASMAVPRTFVPTSEKELKEVAALVDLHRYRYLMKPRSFWGRGVEFPTGKVAEVRSREQLLDIGRSVHARAGAFPLIQELIPGGPRDLYGATIALNRSLELIGFSCHRKLRQTAGAFGVGTFFESWYEPDLVRAGLALLRAMGYYGVAGCEFKRDPRDGKFKLIEVNARFGTTGGVVQRLQGLDLPYRLYQSFMSDGARAQSAADSFRLHPGLRGIWLRTDVRAVIANGGRIPIWSELRDTVVHLARLRGESMFSLHDARPFIMDLRRIRQPVMGAV